MKGKGFVLGLTAFFCGVLTAISSSVVLAQTGDEVLRQDKERSEASRLWEQVIEAKGGREKLHSISNMLRSKSPGQIELYVYPNLYWEWDKGKIVHSYLWIRLSNMDRGVYVVATDQGIASFKKDLDSKGRANYRESNLMDACAFLLETKWLQPSPTRVTREIVNKKQYDVIHTRFPDLAVYKDWGLDFFIEPETHEVKLVRDYSVPYGEGGVWTFDDYISVDGIQMPRKVNGFISMEEMGRFHKGKCCAFSYRFNVAYNSTLFDVVPTEAAGPDAWKPRP